ncbi:MAG: hypothetical protein KDA78_17460 [Planctomycetaceae bacterium]|nr:hypothetical protein [Planctomycetaceae bacterium]
MEPASRLEDLPFGSFDGECGGRVFMIVDEASQIFNPLAGCCLASSQRTCVRG